MHALAPHRYLPKRLQIIGYARTALSDEDLRNNQIRPYLKGDPLQIDEFLTCCSYQQGEVSASPGQQIQELVCMWPQALLPQDWLQPCPNKV